MYATDSLARMYASHALEKGHDLSFEPQLRAFFYLPFMHSENVDDQRRSVELCREGAPANLEYADHHYDIIRRFGRFPHRNAILGRPSTEEEQAFLEGGRLCRIDQICGSLPFFGLNFERARPTAIICASGTHEISQ